MPRGAFVVQVKELNIASNDSIFIVLPTEFQVYNYFKVSYDKNRQVIPATKLNDSTIVFIALNRILKEKYTPIRVETGIVPFFKKN